MPAAVSAEVLVSRQMLELWTALNWALHQNLQRGPTGSAIYEELSLCDLLSEFLKYNQ